MVVGRWAAASINGRGGSDLVRSLGMLASTSDYTNSMVVILSCGVMPTDSIDSHLLWSCDSRWEADFMSFEGAHA